MNKKLAMIFGPRGAGKTTICKMLVERHEMPKDYLDIEDFPVPYASHVKGNVRIHGEYSKDSKFVGFTDYYDILGRKLKIRDIVIGEKTFNIAVKESMKRNENFIIEQPDYSYVLATTPFYRRIKRNGYEICFFFINNDKEIQKNRIIELRDEHLVNTIDLHDRMFETYSNYQSNIVTLNTETLENTLDSVKKIEKYFDL